VVVGQPFRQIAYPAPPGRTLAALRPLHPEAAARTTETIRAARAPLGVGARVRLDGEEADAIAWTVSYRGALARGEQLQVALRRPRGPPSQRASVADAESPPARRPAPPQRSPFQRQVCRGFNGTSTGGGG
jgi:hypothetical protein